MANELKDKYIGQQFGDYQLVRVLASGGMARLYVGRDVNLEREVAVKVLTPEMIASDSLLAERFIREAKSVATLDHPNIIPIYQYNLNANGAYFLAMKLVRGGDLADEISALQKQGQQMPIKRMLKILRQTASALDHAHRHGIIHRDVKPSNILIDRATDENNAILTDFGLVLRQTDIDKTMGTAFGTPRYISPEQALASESVVPQSDIYSLAVIVYEILTGTQVFKADTAMQIALSHISEAPPPPSQINPDIPKAVELEILKALEKDPDLRHSTATQFVEAVADAYGEPMQLSVIPKQTGKLISHETERETSPQPPPPLRQSAPPVIPTPAETPASQATKKPISGNLGLFLVGGVILVAVILAFLILSGGGDDSKEPPVQDGLPAGSTEITGLIPANSRAIFQSAPANYTLGESHEIVLIYNQQAWMLFNPHDANLSLLDMQIIRDDRVYLDANSAVFGPNVPKDRCLLLQTAEERVTVSSEWQECLNPRNTLLLYHDAMFWRGDSGTFTVRLPSGDVECPLTTSESTCTIRLQQIES